MLKGKIIMKKGKFFLKKGKNFLENTYREIPKAYCIIYLK